MYSYRCKCCGSYLDPVEHCDCMEERERVKKWEQKRVGKMLTLEKNGQFRFDFERMMST